MSAPFTDHEPMGAGRRTQAQRRAVAREKLLDAAAALIAERGLAGLTLGDVGARSGYSRGITNHHFGSKSMLVTELVERAQREFTDATAPVHDEASPIDAIVGACRVFLDLLADLPPVHRAFLVVWAGAVVTDHDLRPLLIDSDDRFRRAFAAIIDRGIAAGMVNSEVDPPACAASLVGQLRGIALQHLLAPNAVDLTRVGDDIERSIRRALEP